MHDAHLGLGSHFGSGNLLLGTRSRTLALGERTRASANIPFATGAEHHEVVFLKRPLDPINRSFTAVAVQDL